MDHKVIILLSSEPGVGRGTLADGLCRQWTAQNCSVLQIGPGPLTTPEPPEQWLPRFKNLPPPLLRNYLADPLAPYARFLAPTWPADDVSRDLLALAARAYDRVLVIGPTPEPECAALLDGADLLLWVARPSPDLQQRWSI